jgi:hypothetical protein
MPAARGGKFNACNYSGIESARLILNRSRLALDRSCEVGLVTAGKWLGKDEHGLATTILTKRNSVTISMGQKRQKCQNGL